MKASNKKTGKKVKASKKEHVAEQNPFYNAATKYMPSEYMVNNNRGIKW